MAEGGGKNKAGIGQHELYQYHIKAHSGSMNRRMCARSGSFPPCIFASSIEFPAHPFIEFARVPRIREDFSPTVNYIIERWQLKLKDGVFW